MRVECIKMQELSPACRWTNEPPASISASAFDAKAGAFSVASGPPAAATPWLPVWTLRRFRRGVNATLSRWGVRWQAVKTRDHSAEEFAFVASNLHLVFVSCACVAAPRGDFPPRTFLSVICVSLLFCFLTFLCSWWFLFFFPDPRQDFCVDSSTFLHSFGSLASYREGGAACGRRHRGEPQHFA